MKVSLNFALILSAIVVLAVWSAGCEDLGIPATAEEYYDMVGIMGGDGSDGDPGPQGETGPAGNVGDNGIALLDPAIFPPICDQCIDNQSLADGAAGDTIQVENDSIQTSMIADLAVDTAQIANDSVRREHIKLGSVTGAKLEDSAIIAGKLAADAVTPGDIGPGAIVAENIADASIDTQHFVTNSFAKVWTVTGRNDTALTTFELDWTNIQDMDLEVSGEGGPYLILFDSSFSAVTGVGTTITPGNVLVRLVVNSGGNTYVLSTRPIPSVLTRDSSIVRDNDLGHFSMHWSGMLDPGTYPLPHVFQIQWRNYSSVTIRQRKVEDGTRKLTIMEFSKACYNGCP